MPPNRNFGARIRIINNCFGHSTRKYWSLNALVDKINELAHQEIKPRTLLEDIRRMKAGGPDVGKKAPIKFSKERGGYYYTEKDFSIDNLPLNEKDIKALEFATTTLAQYKDVKILNEFVGTVDKLITVVNELKYTNHTSQFSFIDFEKAASGKGYDHLDVFIESIKNKIVVEILYKKFEDNEKMHQISPYLLKQYRNRWYLLGFGIYANEIQPRTFALDRIINISPQEKQPFIERPGFNKDLFFKNTIGINYLDGNPVEVVLSFDSYQGNFIKTQFLHESQKILIDDDTEFRIKLFVVDNYELESIILGYGSDVEVISPLSLRQKITRIVAECYSIYGGNAPEANNTNDDAICTSDSMLPISLP